MLTQIYTEALLVDEEAADLVWAEWNANKLTDGAARKAWFMIAGLFWPDDQHGYNRDA